MLVSRSLEQEECPIKGSSARVARNERIASGCRRPVTSLKPRAIVHFRLAEDLGGDYTYLEVMEDGDGIG
jgi:hypothetical protein